MDRAAAVRLGLHAGALALLVAIVAAARPAPGSALAPATPQPLAPTASAGPATEMPSPPTRSAIEVEASSPLRGTLLDEEIRSWTVGRLPTPDGRPTTPESARASPQDDTGRVGARARAAAAADRSSLIISACSTA